MKTEKVAVIWVLRVMGAGGVSRIGVGYGVLRSILMHTSCTSIIECVVFQAMRSDMKCPSC